MRRTTLALAVVILAVSCNRELSLTEFAAEVEALVTTHTAGMDENDQFLNAEPPTVERIRAYATRRMELRNAFLTGFEELEPPRQAEDITAAALETIRSLVEAEQVLFERASSTDDVNELSGIWETPEGQAARAADAQAVAICQAAEAALNSTEDRQALIGMPWVPSELQEVVNVAFGCTAADR